MDIAALSMNFSSMKTMQGVEIAMTKKVMNIQEQQGEALKEMLTPPSNHILDVRA